MTDPGVILLVEDNPDDEALTLRALARNHIRNQVVVARDGVEALALLHGDADRPPGVLPAVVLLDLKLPKIDGLEVLRRLRSHPRTCLVPVVMLTSSMEERDLAASYGRGVNSYVRKPVDFAAFMEAVRQLGLYWLVLNAGPPAPGETP
jgi:two-component system response regulator